MKLNSLEEGIRLDYKPYLIWKLNEANEFYIPKHAGYDFSNVDFYNEGKVECPCCRAVGRDNSGDNLHLYGVDENGHPLGGKCFRTELVIPSYAKAKEDYDYDMLEYNGTAIKDAKGNKVIRGESMSDVKRVSKDSVNQKKLKEKRLSEKEVQDVIENSGTDPKGFRRLTQAVCEKYGVRFQYNKKSGDMEKILFPSMVFEDGEYKTVGYKIRDFTIPKKGDGHFTAIGYVGALNTFFGQHVVQNTKNLLITSGECDLLAADMMLESLKTYKSGYSVVTSMSGEPSTAECCKHNYDFVTKFSAVVIALDNDKTGKDSEKKVIDVLPNEILHTVNLSYKDPCDYWKAFKVDKKMDAVECFVQDIHWNRKVVKSFGLVGSRSLLAKAIESVIQPKIPLPAFMKDLDDYFTDGIGLGEIVNIISNTSTGKSVFVNEIITDWIVNAPYKMCILSLEDNAGSYGAKIASRMLGRKIHKIKGAENRKKILEENADVILEFLTDENGEDAFQFLEETFGSLADVKKAILQAIKVAGCKIIVIDPLVNLISNKSMEEQIDFMLFEEDCRRVHNVTFINVCHTRKIGGGAVKAASKGGEIAEEDVKGTSQITGSATINIILRRNKTADCPIIRNTTEVDITKNRSDGTTGQSCAKIFYHGNSHTLIPYSIAEENNFYQDGEKVNMNLKGVTPVTTQDTPESDEDVKITKDLAAVDRTANVDFG